MTVVHVMNRIASHDEQIDFFMTATQFTGKITNMEPHKCDDLQFFQLDNPPENIVD